MDSNQLRRLEFFSVPNNQTANPVDRPFDLTAPAGNRPPPSVWDSNVLAGDSGAAGSPSTAPGSLSMESFAQSSPSTAPTSMSMNPAPTLPPMLGRPSQPFPSRPPRMREGHERKRSRLSADANPFDSVDYWIQFDNEEALSHIPERPEPSRTDSNQRPRAHVAQQNSVDTTQPMPSGLPPVSSEDVFKTERYVGGSALDNAVSDEEETFSSINLADQLSKIESAPPSEIPPREGLYSTPLSWERPLPGLRMDPLSSLNSAALNEAEQRRLIAIAMNTGPSMGGLGSNSSLHLGGQQSSMGPGFETGYGTAAASQPTNAGAQPRPAAQTRPVAQGKPPMGKGDKGKEKAKSGDRTAHNDIERKYRTNLKDKIAELRDAVPSLQTAPDPGDDAGESSHQRAAKVSKGTVMTKATEYIHYLERRNRQIVLEHQELSRRLQAFEQLLHATTRPTFQMPNYSRTLFDPRAFC